MIDKIFSYIEQNPQELEAYNDLFQLLRGMHDDNELDYEQLVEFRKLLSNKISEFSEIDPDMSINLYTLLSKTYLLTAKDRFEDYMVYLEWDREPKDKFYMPRRKVLKPVVEALQDITDGKSDELFLSMPPRVGKALANDTPILTTKGWKNHGDLEIGDVLYKPDGGTTKVIAVHPKCDMTHTIRFTDRTTIDCHFRHEWKVYDRRFSKVRVLETQELIGHLKNGNRNNFMLLQNEPIIGEHKKLSVDPYTFGVWLGDGSNNKPRINGDKKDNAIIERIKSNDYEINHIYVHKTTGVISTEFKGLKNDLKKIGLCFAHRRADKYIPEEYYGASLEQRLQLLAGLIDTDGCLRRKENRYDYVTCDEKLKDCVITLISTFGWKPCVVEKKPKLSSSGIQGKKNYWVISFNPTFEIPCALERKKTNKFSKFQRIAIDSIEEIKVPKKGNCITVEYDGMYLAGNRLTPTHNTTLMLFYTTWIIGRDSERSNLYSAFSDTITTAFYNGVLEILKDDVTYKWHDIFSEQIANTNAKEEILNIGRKKRYPSLTARSLYGTLNGACDCNGILISDDLIGGIEEALNPDRLYATWSKVDNNLLPRCKETARQVWVGTRWSKYDPIGLRLDALENNEKFKGRRWRTVFLPALDENDESNFDYDFGVGFSTDYYHQRRASFEKRDDMASWYAQYMGEPVERSGLLFDPMNMNYFNGELPQEGLVRKFMACDPAFGGGDFVAAPICYEYDDGRCFVVDVCYSNENKMITQPMIANKIMKWQVKSAQFECNQSTMAYKEKIEDLLKEKQYRLNIFHRSAPNNVAKETRIYENAPEIRELYFLESGKRDKMYESFMQNVFAFTMNGKNKHDDAPDSLAMLVQMKFSSGQNIAITRRRF